MRGAARIFSPRSSLEGAVFGRRLSQSRIGAVSLIVAQIAVCLTLLSCAGLLVRKMLQLRSFDVGFDPRALVNVNVSPRAADPGGRGASAAFQRQAAETIRQFPGVTGVWRNLR